MEVPKGLYEVLMSENLSVEQKRDSIQMFALPTHHLNHKGEMLGIQQPAITKEDADLLCEALEHGEITGLTAQAKKGK